jgi:TonB-dependent starch-binding outer membrane protein SusC
MIMKKLYRCLKFGAVFLLLLLSVPVFAQVKVSGTILDDTGQPLPGVSILEKGTSNGTTTDTDGKYSLNVASSSSTLVFSFIGYVSAEEALNGRSSVDLTMQPDITALQEVIVTGYTTERKKDIIGSVAVVNPKTTIQQPAANLSSMLQGRAAGVTVSGSGAPGAASKVRIRGFVSFGNNDPLYVIDGVPTDNANTLNPQDISSVQVLKDPVSASIYGSRAANGVIVITTKSGASGKHEITYDAYYGSQTIPERAYPKMLNTAQYGEYLWRSMEGAGLTPSSNIYGNGGSPVAPAQLWTSMDVTSTGVNGAPRPDEYEVFPDKNPDLYGPYQIYNTSAGTDWHKEISQAGRIQSHQIGATGGSEKAQYALGLNYFNQEGVYKYTNYDRYTLRSNTRFMPNKWLTIGENLQVGFTKSRGGNGNPADLGGGLDFSGEGNAWAQAYRMVPYIPVYDINGNWGGNGVTNSGNGTNPVANLWRNRNNGFAGFNMFGNVYARVNFLKDFTASSSFGIDQRLGNGYGYTYITYERSENQKNNSFGEFFFRGGSWTWTNSLQYSKKIAEKHDVRVFAAVESFLEQFRTLGGSRNDYDFSDVDFVSLNTGKSGIQNFGAPSTPRALYSMFGKAEYQFDDRYLLSFTVRQDQASVFGSENRTGVFPAVGAGWRISEESFMQGISAITELKLRGGWGQMGSQRNVPTTNQYTFYVSSPTGTAYDIGGGGTSTLGYRLARVGNTSTKWETAEMTNIGIDGTLFDGKIDFTLEYFNNTTKDLLVDKQPNGLEANIGQPKINVGTMVNKGIDGSISTRGDFGSSGLAYDVAITYTSYKNEAKKLDAEGVGFFEQGAGRLAPIQRTEAGQALSTFWGYEIEGLYQTTEEVNAGPVMPYKRIGSWKIKDQDGNDTIDSKDQTYLGSPIPKFQLGTDLILKFKGFDMNAFFYWNYGNKVYNYTKWWTDLRGFVGGVSERVLTDSWSEDNTGGTLPVLNSNDTYSGSISTDYYIESGSYFRLRQLQLGYTIPEANAKRIGLNRARIYVQGQNLITVTKYSGPDPDISIQGDELAMGVDQFRTPAPSVYMIGLSLGF